MMHTFRIEYVKHGNCTNYLQEEKVQATSEKMAWKKFYNHKSYPKDKTRRQWMDYEREVNGIWYDNFKITKFD